MKTRKPRKHIVIFFVMGLIGINLEIAARWLGNDLPEVGLGSLRFASAAGWTSMWMFAVYGLAGIVLGHLNATRIGRLPMALQALVGVVIMLAFELLSGWALNLQFRLDCWDYTSQPLNFHGQICAPKAVEFFFLAPFAFWVDDMIRFIAYDERRPGTLWSYYRALVDRRGNPQARAAATTPTTLCSQCGTPFPVPAHRHADPELPSTTTG